MAKDNKRLRVIELDSSALAGIISPGSSVYADSKLAVELPRSEAFVAAISNGSSDEARRYFTAQAQHRGKRTVLRLGQEHDSNPYTGC